MLTPPDMVRFFGLAVTVKSVPFLYWQSMVASHVPTWHGLLHCESSARLEQTPVLGSQVSTVQPTLSLQSLAVPTQSAVVPAQ
jgi:hypothetical protein